MSKNLPSVERRSAHGRALVIEISCPTPDQDPGSLSTLQSDASPGRPGLSRQLPAHREQRPPAALHGRSRVDGRRLAWRAAFHFSRSRPWRVPQADDYDLVVLCRHLAAERVPADRSASLSLGSRDLPARSTSTSCVKEGRRRSRSRPSIAADGGGEQVERACPRGHETDATIVVSSYEADVLEHASVPAPWSARFR